MRGKKLSQEEHERRLALYEQGLSDREIGEIVGVNHITIYTWRKKYQLVTKYVVKLKEKIEQPVDNSKAVIYRQMLRSRFLDPVI